MRCNIGIMKGAHPTDLFINERTMTAVSVTSALCGILSMILMMAFHTLSLMSLFEGSVKLLVTLLALWSFFRYHWDMMKGLLGSLLFSILYEEANVVLGHLWGATADFDTYLIMGVEGSLFLAAQTMSLMMTIVITANHYIIAYSLNRNERNLVFNKLSILFKITLYISLILINFFLDLPLYTQINEGLKYSADLCMVIILVCIETQLDSFEKVKQDVKQAKKQGGVKA